MVAVSKVLDVPLFIFFLFFSIGIPLLDAQIILPIHLFPSVVVDFNSWYVRKYSDYLISEKPHFVVGLVWLELLILWPLCLVSTYGIAAGKSWVNTTCLLTGTSFFTAVVPIISELALSTKGSIHLVMVYSTFLIFSVLALLRALLAPSCETIGKSPVLNGKKRA